MKWTLSILLFICFYSTAQKTDVSGKIVDGVTDQPITYAKVHFKNSKIGTLTDTNGYYELNSYYATDTLVVQSFGYKTKKIAVVRDQSQVINFRMESETQALSMVTIHGPKEPPSITLLKNVIRNKPVNNKEKLTAYQYESYNKIQFDLNNIKDKFKESKLVQNLDVLMHYLDTVNGTTYLPLMLTESLSDFYYRRNPTKKKEVIKASRITGIDNLKVNRFLGDMYQDINVYDNYIKIFDKSFISPIANFSQAYYHYYLKDSMFIGNKWCYLLEFKPKRSGNLTFKGKMWVNDTTYAVKKWQASVPKTVNINYVNGFFLQQKFDEIESGVWMLSKDVLLVDLKVLKKAKAIGFLGRKVTTRNHFIVNTPHPPSFYDTKDKVKIEDSAKIRTPEYWVKHRHIPLSEEEANIDVMLDSLNQEPLFKTLKNVTFLLTTGFYPLGKVELGNLWNVISFNPVEGFRNQLELETSNDFSRRIELWGKIAYGYRDQRFKYGGQLRFNVTPKKRGMLTLLYDKDVHQLGLGSNPTSIDFGLASLVRTKPIRELTMVEKYEAKFSKDVGKSWNFTVDGRWQNLERLGDSKFRVPTPNGFDNIHNFQTFETSLQVRFAKNETYLAGAFNRVSLGSKYPILTLKGTVGIKGVFGSEYEYQKLEFSLEHTPSLGILGKMKYKIFAGMYFGNAPYPLLKIHNGSQTYWLRSDAFNMMDYYEFISDEWVGAQVEHHFNGLFLDRIPLLKKLDWRIVVSGRAVWGTISDRQKQVMLLPDNTKSFGNIPYVESTVGIENIFKLFRVDLVWRMTHQIPGESPLGIRAKFQIRF